MNENSEARLCETLQHHRYREGGEEGERERKREREREREREKTMELYHFLVSYLQSLCNFFPIDYFRVVCRKIKQPPSDNNSSNNNKNNQVTTKKSKKKNYVLKVVTR
jgi:hypothetical protein